MNNLTPTSASSRLVRSAADRRIAGVCGGIGDYFAVDPIIVRLVFVALAFGGVGLLMYPIMWLVMPSAAGAAPNVSQNFAELRNQIQHQVYPGANARFDPMTGRPLQTEAPRFDAYTGASLPSETAVPIANHPVNPPAAAPSGPLTTQQRRQRFLGIALIALALLTVDSIGWLLIPALLIGGGFMLLRRAA